MTNYSSLLQWNYPTPVTPPEAIFGYILLMVVLVFPWIKFALYKATSYTSSIDEYTPLCQFINNYRLPFGEIYENYPLSIFTKCSHLSSFNFVVIFYNHTKGSFPNWLDRLAYRQERWYVCVVLRIYFTSCRWFVTDITCNKFVS